jgi:hypothetical protein
MKEPTAISGLGILERSSGKSLGPGNLGVLIARAGVGKTACLIHFAFDKIFRKEKLVHVSLEETPEKIMGYYDVIFRDLTKSLEVQDDEDYRELVEKKRIILAYLKKSFGIERLRANLRNLVDNLEFQPVILIVDGLDFGNVERPLIEDFKRLAEEFQSEIWFSALSHRHISEVNERGIPYPCNEVDDLFSFIVLLEPTKSGVFLRVLKENNRESVPAATLQLDPKTFLMLE